MVSTLEARVPLAVPPSPGTSTKAGSRARGLKPAGILPLHGLLRDLEASWQCRGPGWERRQLHRNEFRQTVRLIPLDEQTELPLADALFVEVHDISASGIGFRHGMPLSYKKVELTLVLPGGIEITAIARLLWCRFTREGYYESGGQFVRCSGL